MKRFLVLVIISFAMVSCSTMGTENEDIVIQEQYGDAGVDVHEGTKPTE